MDKPIANLSEVLHNYLGHEKTIVDLETTRLTATGENYGSQMLALKIHLNTECLEVVAKLPPPGEFLRRMFNIPVTFRNEVDFYKTIIPELQTFLTERGISGYLDNFPEFLGARWSPQNKEVDDDGVLILENLKTKGYEMIERTVGFDYESAKLVIQAMAKYHAAPLGLKLLKPEVFREKIRPLFYPYKIFEFDSATLESIVEKYRKMIDEIDSCKQYTERVLKAFRASLQPTKNLPDLMKEPFATIIHTDAWVNNFMVKYQDEKPVHCKIVDFQLGEYGSPARDVIFFIYSSVQIPVVKEHYENLVKLYHQTLVDGLAKFGCTTESFSFAKFEEEIESAVKEFEVFQCLMMLQPIFATKDDLKELEDYTDEDMSKETSVSPKLKERLEFLVLDFVKRKWV